MFDLTFRACGHSWPGALPDGLTGEGTVASPQYAILRTEAAPRGAGIGWIGKASKRDPGHFRFMFGVRGSGCRYRNPNPEDTGQMYMTTILLKLAEVERAAMIAAVPEHLF